MIDHPNLPIFIGLRVRILEFFWNFSFWGRGQNVYFLLGDPKSEKQKLQIANEAVEHNDIVQKSFEDIYRHLTFKTVLGYLWTRDQCNASYIVKIDDDCLVNMDAIKDYL